MADGPATVFVIDDHPEVRESVTYLAQSIGLQTVECRSGEDFLNDFEDKTVACVVADLRLPRMSGLQLVKECRSRAYPCPIILITGFPEVEVAVDAMKAGAFDFIAKPFSAHRLIEAIQAASEASIERHRSKRHRSDALQTLKKLSEREWDVAKLMAEGLRTKDIARRLELSHRTVEKYRHNVHHKTGVPTVAGLVSLFASVNQSFTELHAG